MESRLGILMDSFAISGKDLSVLLHIDTSLVSKWRNGKRRMKPNSVYTGQIIKHVMALDSNNQYAKIRLLLSKDYVNIYKCTEPEIAIFLKDWLTSNQISPEEKRDFFDEIREMHSTSQLTVYSLSGTAGRRQAMQFFQRYAQHISPGVEILCYTTESLRWLNESDQFREEWWTRYLTLLESANTIKVIHPFNGSYENLAMSVLAWMPMHMTGRTTAFFIPRYKDEQMAYTYYLIKDHLALYNWSSRQTPRELNTYLTHEPALIKDTEMMLNSFLAESIRAFERFYFETKDDYINNLISVMERQAPEYHWSVTLSGIFLPEDTLRSLLAENGVLPAELDECIERIKLMAELSTKSTHTHIVDLDKLRDVLTQDYIEIKELSFASGKLIKMRRWQFIRMIRNGLDLSIRSDNLRMCIASPVQLRRLGDTDIMAKEGGRICFSSSAGDRPIVLMTQELTIVAALYSYLEEVWNTTSNICRNKEYVKNQIIKLLDEAEED